MKGHHLYSGIWNWRAGLAIYRVFSWGPLRKVCFVGVKEQVVNDSEGLLWCTMKGKTNLKKIRTFSFLYCLFNICFSTFKANGQVIKCSEIFNGYIRMLDSKKNIIALDISLIEHLAPLLQWNVLSFFNGVLHSGLRLMNTNEVLHMLYWTNNNGHCEPMKCVNVHLLHEYL